jgi:magnesium-transporting ATPase (P-type)
MRTKIFSKKNFLDVLMINAGVNVILALLVYLLIAPMFLSPSDLEQFDTLILTLIEHGDFLGLALIQLIPFWPQWVYRCFIWPPSRAKPPLTLTASTGGG